MFDAEFLMIKLVQEIWVCCPDLCWKGSASVTKLVSMPLQEEIAPQRFKVCFSLGLVFSSCCCKLIWSLCLAQVQSESITPLLVVYCKWYLLYVCGSWSLNLLKFLSRSLEMVLLLEQGFGMLWNVTSLSTARVPEVKVTWVGVWIVYMYLASDSVSIINLIPPRCK